MEPINFSQIIGQENIVRELRAIINADACVSILLRGQYGSGKTTLAKLYAKSFGGILYYEVPPGKDFKAYMRGVVVDEIHMESTLELYYPHMTDGKHNIAFCTTEAATLPGAFKSRCLQFVIQPYTLEDIVKIVTERLERGLTYIQPSQALEIAKRARLNPRVAILLAQRIYRLVKLERMPFQLQTIIAELDRLGIDERGYDDRHRAYLRCLEAVGRPIGLKTLSMRLGIDVDTLQEEIEPTLIKDGLVEVTSRGRIIS